MKIDRLAAEGRNLFSGYGEGYVEVNGQRLGASALVGAQRIEAWDVRSVAALDMARIAPILAMKPEIVLLGTGARFVFPDPAVLRHFYEARIGIEAMDTRAACRTFNILLAEDRNVVAALIVE